MLFTNFLITSALAVASSACIVPLVLFNSLDYEFTIVTQAPDHPSIDRQTITLSPLSTGEGYSAVLSTGDVQNMTLSDSKLSSDDGFTALLQVPIKTTYRAMLLTENPENPVEFYAKYGCDRDDKMITVIDPVGGDDGALTFCAVADPFGDEMIVAIKPTSDSGACTPFIAAVTDGIRPL